MVFITWQRFFYICFSSDSPNDLMRLANVTIPVATHRIDTVLRGFQMCFAIYLLFEICPKDDRKILSTTLWVFFPADMIKQEPVVGDGIEIYMSYFLWPREVALTVLSQVIVSTTIVWNRIYVKTFS